MGRAGCSNTGDVKRLREAEPQKTKSKGQTREQEGEKRRKNDSKTREEERERTRKNDSKTREEEGEENRKTDSKTVTVEGCVSGIERANKREKKSKTGTVDAELCGTERASRRKGKKETKSPDVGRSGEEPEKTTDARPNGTGKKRKGNTIGDSADNIPSCEAMKKRHRRTKRSVQSVQTEVERNWKHDRQSPNLVGGKFTKDECEELRLSIIRYIEMRQWDMNEGFQKVLCTSKYKEARGCWTEIAKSLPFRPVKAIYTRARRMIENRLRGTWSNNEVKQLTRLQAKYGHDWAKISSFMRRTADVCKDKWRHQKMVPTRITGHWEQDELDRLCKLVRKSRQMRATLPGRRIGRRKVREDLNWEWIAGKMQRDSARCAETWYHRLSSRMIPHKKWSPGDDRLLLRKLFERGAVTDKDMDWDTLLYYRGGDVCQRRWGEMTLRLDRSRYISFKEKLELLARRFAPDLLEIDF